MTSTRPPHRALGLLAAALLAVASAPSGAQSPDGASTAEPPSVGGEGLPYADYLDAVRAQREALLEQARRREGEAPPPPYPLGDRRDAQREALEQNRYERREAMRERQEWHDQASRWRRYWNNPYGAWLDEVFDQRQRTLEAQAEARHEQLQQLRDELERMRPGADAPQPMPPFAPYSPYGPGLGGPWYYPY
jgi:hypothetical protein